MGSFYDLKGYVGASQAGLGFQCRPSGVLELLQEAATQAAAQFHASGAELLEKYGAIWMVSRMWYRLDRPLMWDEHVDIRTWHRADRGAMLYRDFDLTVDGASVGEAVSVWVLVDAQTRKLRKLNEFQELAATGGGELCKDKKLTRIKLPAQMEPAQKRTFHYSDIDCNGHVNNVRYADMAADALAIDRAMAEDLFVSQLQIGYQKECLVGETLDLLTGQVGDTGFVHGVDEQGESRFDAALTLSKLPRK